MNNKESIIAKRIGEQIKAYDPHAEVILFGSHATGHAKNESDWDVLILINEQKTSRSIEKPYRDRMFELELEIGQPISTLVYSKDYWEQDLSSTNLFNNIKNDGIKLS